MLVAACSGGQDTERTSTTEAVTTTMAPPTTMATATTTIAPDAAPPELSGIWETEFADGETLRLDLRGRSYTASVVGDPQGGSGKISVEGDTIEFSGSISCLGDPGSTYTWTIEGETLTFALVDEDPCGRKAFLDGSTFTLFSDLP